VRKRLYDIGRLLISAVLLVVLFTVFDLRDSWNALKGMNWVYFVLSLLLFQTKMVIRAYRWRFLLDALGVHVPIARLTYLYYVGVFFNTFLPSGFGGDAVKMVELNSYSKRGSESISTVLVDRLAGIVVSFALGLVAWPFVRGQIPTEQSTLMLLASAGGLVATWFLFQRRLADRVISWMPEKIRERLQGLYDAIHRCGSRALLQAVGVSVVFNLVLFAMNYFLALAVGHRVPFVYIAAFMPIISLSMLIPSVGALGTREGAYALLFGSIGMPEPVAIAMSLAFYLSNVLTGLVGGVLYAIQAIKGLGARSTEQS